VPVGAALATAYVKVRPDTAGFGRDLDAQVSREADGKRTGEKIGRDLGQGIAKGVSPLITSAVALGPALVPVLATATAAAGGLGVALVSGGAAMGVFGAVAKSAFKAITDNSKLAAKGTEDLTSPVGRATVAYEGLTAAWDRFVARNQPQVFTAFGAGFAILTRAIPKLQPLFSVASDAVVRFEGQIGHFVSGGGMDRLVHFLATNARPALESFRQTFTNLGTGLGALSPLFARFAAGVEVGMVQLSARFAAWAQNAGPGGGFQRFINYVVANGPAVASTLHELASAAVNIAQGLAPLGPVSLSFVGAMARLIAVLPPGVVTGLAAGFVSIEVAIKGAAIASQLFNVTVGRTPIGLISVALAGLIGLFVRHAQAVAEARQKTDEYAGTIDKTSLALTANTRATVANNLETAGAYKAAAQLGIAYSLVTDAAMGNVSAQASVNRALAAYTASQQEAASAGDSVNANAKASDDAFRVLTGAISGTNVQIQNAVAKQKRLQQATAPTTVAIISEKQAADNARRSMEQLAGQLLKLAGINLSVAQTDIQFRDSLTSLSASVKSNGRSLDINTAKGRANRSAVLDSISAALQHADAVGKQTHSQTRAQQAFQNSIPAIEAQARKLGLNKRQVDELIRSIGGLRPKTVPVTVAIRGKDLTIDGGAGRGVVGQTHAAAYGGWIPGQSPHDRADNIPVWMTGQEFVIQRPTARKIQRQAPGFLDALNSGALDIGGDPAAMLGKYAAKMQPLHFAGGGSIPSVQAFLRAQDPKPYIWGGTGPGGWDCSGLAGAAYALLTGQSPYRRYFTTASNFAALGFRRGLGTFSMGLNPGTHMDVNLAGFGAEAQSTATGIKTGGAATPVTRFAQQWYLPQVGGRFIAAGGFPGLTTAQIHRVVALTRPAIIASIFRELGITKYDTGGYLTPGKMGINVDGGRERVLNSRETVDYERGGNAALLAELRMMRALLERAPVDTGREVHRGLAKGGRA
jgi:cell wall-associated NlpC family hydrolase